MVLLYVTVTCFLLFGTVPSQAANYGLIGLTGTSPNPVFNLEAKSGYITPDDGNSIFMWGFANGTGPMQYPGPNLIVNQGDNVTVNLTNQLTVPVSIVFPGQTNVTATGGTPGLLTNEAAAGGGSVTYTFTASEPGTYTYHSGTQVERQVEMGLSGTLIVRPSMATPAGYAGCGYNSADSCFHREYLFFLNEIDHVIHEKVLFGLAATIDNTTAFPVYWFINGRTALDTVAENLYPILPTQPYSALVLMHPNEKILVRMVGGGRAPHPLHLHGNHHRLIARDGRLFKGPTGQDFSEGAFTTTVAPGQTADGIFVWTGVGLGWDIYGHAPGDPLATGECPGGLADPDCDHGKPLPVFIPSNEVLTFGPLYTGSPFIGGSGTLPPGEGGFNPWNGLPFMWHSHSEKELTSFNIFPGGMLTWAIVVHPDLTIP